MVRTVIVVGLATALATAQDFVSFNHQILPILQQHCFECHNHGEDSQGPNLLQMGFRSGSLISPTELLARLEDKVPGKPRMPLDKPPLDENTIRLIRKWFENGVMAGGAFPIEIDVNELKSQPRWAVSCFTPTPAILVVNAGENPGTTPRYANARTWTTWSLTPRNAETIRLTVQPIATDDPGNVIFVVGDAPLDARYLAAQAECIGQTEPCFELVPPTRPTEGRFHISVPDESRVHFLVQAAEDKRLAVDQEDIRPSGWSYFKWDLRFGGKESAEPGDYNGVFHFEPLNLSAAAPKRFFMTIRVTLTK